MPIVFSPIDQEELSGVFQPKPRSAFVMLHAGNEVHQSEKYMSRRVKKVLSDFNVDPITATSVSGSGDFLKKIIQLIQACGFGIAVFSDNTPNKTLGNIFFEAGVCLTLGKPVQLVISGDQAAPSDFVRTEWVKLESNNKRKFNRQLKSSIERMLEYGEYVRTLGDLAMQAEHADFELAFERYKQAVLIQGDQSAIQAITNIRDRLHGSPENEIDERVMANHRIRLSQSTREFISLLPESSQR